MIKFIINYIVFVIGTTLAISIIPILWLIPLVDKKERENLCKYWIWSEEQIKADSYDVESIRRMHDLY